MASTTKFIDKSPKNKDIKSVFILIASSLFFISTSYYFLNPGSLYIVPSNFSKLDLYYSDNINSRKFCDCVTVYENSIIQSEIRYRGSSILNYEKKDYRIQLSRKESLFGMRNDDDWQLFGCYLDFTRMRVKLSMDLWRSLKETDSTAILPKTEYIALYKNDKFQGLYLLGERTDRKLFDLEKTIKGINSSLIFQAKTETNFKKYIKDCWEQDWPNKKDGNIIDQILPKLINYVVLTDDNEFFDPENGIFSKFDKLNLIDYYIYNFFIDHKDCWEKNYFLVRHENPSKFYFVPWDFEGSLGQWGWIKYDSDDNPDSEIRNSHFLWNRLLNNTEFMKDCKNRWYELREKLWTEESILNMFFDEYSIIKELIKIDTDMWKPITVDEKPKQRWPYMYKYSTKEFDLEEYISYLIKWIPERLTYCDSHFSKF
ncbi:MAG: CotH kinase family protein [Candidatus Hermodarchaeota archaeon]